MTSVALLSTSYASYILRMMEGKLSTLKGSPQGLSGFTQLLNIFPHLLALKLSRQFICFCNICVTLITLNPVNVEEVHRYSPHILLMVLEISEFLIAFKTFSPKFQPSNEDFRWTLVCSLNLPFFLELKVQAF